MQNNQENVTSTELVVDNTGSTNAEQVKQQENSQGTQDQSITGSDGSTSNIQVLDEEAILNLPDDALDSIKLTEINATNTSESTSVTSTEEKQNQVDDVDTNQQTETTENVNTTEEVNNNAETTNQEVSEELAFYQAVTAPFKANNTQVQIKNPEDVIRLMQMGLNYNEKMANLKPHMRILRSLDKAGLLDESKLNHLIDLANHKPEAIAQLIKDSQVDSYNLPDIEEKPYVAQNHMLPQEQVDFEETVVNLSKNVHGSAVLQTVYAWDEASMQTLFKNPVYLEQLAEQKETGLFDDTIALIKQELALGRLDSSRSMVDLYNDVATALLQQEGSKYAKPSWWNKVQQSSVHQVAQNTVQQPVPNVTQQSNVNAQQQTQQRNYIGSSNVQQTQTQAMNNAAPKTASITRGTTDTVQTRIKAQDILDMSDEDFEQFQRNVNFVK